MAPRSKWRPATVRISGTLSTVDQALVRRAGLGAQWAGVSRPRQGRWLRALREMAHLYGRSPQDRVKTAAWLRRELPALFRKLPFDPEDLGARNPSELMRIFSRMIDRVDLRRTYPSLSVLKRKAGGFRSTPRGELFELLADNLRPLRKLYREQAVAALAELQMLMSGDPARVINGRGVSTPVRGTFSATPRMARDFVIKHHGIADPVKYLDRAQLSELSPLSGRQLNKRYFGLLTGMELKTRGAALRGLRRQIGRILPRMREASVEYIACTIDGEGRVQLKPDQVLLTERVRLVGVTHPEDGASPVAAWKLSKGVGATDGESYLHYEVEIKLKPLNFLVDLLFPIGSRKR
jgi:hypothetical protein